ncbi:MAG: hypothetical protein Ct9H300mP5_3820 [Candidatus Pelagibacterales bacterium]|nr:MAG: hypothetical protein Ct9H300mP5_3820 [Pelagibacterales bacterium]
MEQGLFLQKLSDALEESENKIIFPFSVGSTILLIITFGYMEENLSRKIKI